MTRPDEPVGSATTIEPGERVATAPLATATVGLSPVVVWAVAGWMAALAGWAVVGSDGVLDPGRARGPLAVVGVLAALAVARVAIEGFGSTPGRRVGSHRWTLVGIVVVAIALGGLAAHRRLAMGSGPLVALATDGGVADMVATVASEPAMRADGSAWSLVTVTRAGDVAGRWRALLSGQRDPPAVGTRLLLASSARPLGDADFDGYLRRRHAVVALDPVDVEVLAPPRGVLAVVEAVRDRIRAAAAAGLGGDPAGLAVGLVTGDTRLLSEEAQDAMRATGLTHLVAVSGSNVALVAGVVAGLAGAAGARLRRLLVVTSIVAFTVTTRAEPSVLRAAVMALVVMVAMAAGRPRAGLHALSVAVLLLLVADPASAGSLGLALSATATLGVLVVAPVVATRLPSWMPGPLGLLLAATLGAQLTVAPVILAGIGDVPLAAIPANMVAVPAAAVASLVAVVAAVVAQFDVTAGAQIMALAGPPLDAVLAVAGHGDVGPVLSSSAPWGLAAAGLAVVALVAPPRSGVRRWSAALLVAGVLAVTVGARIPAWRPPDHLAVTAIDVGQGDAVLVTTASGHRMLVDTGRDAAAANWLQRQGITTLDLLVITHADADHAGGLDEVLAVVAAPVLWVTAASDGTPEPPWARDWRDEALPASGLPTGTVAVHAGASAVLGSARLEVLGPPPGHELVGTEGGRNDRSVVVRVTEGDRVALLPGDAEHAAQRWLLDHHDVATGLLMVPHHGAATSEAAFLQATRPRVAIVSVGADNGYGHPRPEVLDLLVGMGTVVHRTDRDGTVTVEVPRPP